MANKSIIPQLRFPEFNGNWFEITLSDLLSFKNGVNASKENYGSGYKFINVLDIIKNEFIIYDKIIGSVNISKKEFENFKVEYGDILFQRSSETREDVGQASVYLDRNNTSTYGGFVIRGKMKSDYNPSFMNMLLKTSNARNEITSKSGGSTRYNVGQETLSSVKIFTTTIKEQTKIADFITKVDTQIQLLEKEKTLLEEYKKGISQKIFNQEIRFKDDNGNYFPDWEEKILTDICHKKSSNISANTLENNSGIYKVYGANGLFQTVNFFEENEEYISIVKDGAGIGRIMFCEAKSSVLGTMDIIKPNENVDIGFLFSVLLNINFKKYGIGSTIPHIYFKDYCKEKINIPSKPEQQKISGFISSIESSIHRTESQIFKSKDFKKGLLQKMFV